VQRLSVLVFDLRADLRVKFGRVEPSGGLGHRPERVVDRVHDVVLADCVEGAAQRLAGEGASGRDPDSVSPNTVKTHIRHLYAKFGTHHRAEAVDLARTLGLLAPSRTSPASR
jgi:hypothetical protein